MPRRLLAVGLVVAISACVLRAGAESRFEETVKKTLVTLDKISTTLATISDGDTAKNAQPQLRKVADEFVQLRKETEKLPPPSKDEKDRLARDYKTKLEAADKKLKAEVSRVEGISGGREALQEIRAVMTKGDVKTP